MCKLITSVISGVMDASLKAEIIATITEKLEGMTKDEINIATKAYFDQDTDNIPDAIQKLRIAVSYDMGWQKRATEKYMTVCLAMDLSLDAIQVILLVSK